jgi:uncharacterized protein
MTSSDIPTRFDAVQFVRMDGMLSGSVEAVSLERVAEVCSSVPGRIEWSLDGHVDGAGVPWLQLAVTGALKLECQRCLEEVAVHVRSQSRFRLVPAGEPWNDEDLDDDSFEVLELDGGGALDVQALIEDEVLLALPAIALHEQCVPPGAEREAVAGRPSPFAVLGKLKQS